MFIEVTTHAEQKPKINIKLITAIIDKQVHFAGGLVLDLTEESMKEVLTAIAPKEKSESRVDKDLLAFFEELHTLTGGKGKTVFSLKREKQLKDLLGKHRFSKEDLIRAATNIGKDEFLQGDNDRKKRYGTIDYLLRPDKAAMWSDEQAEKKKKGMF